MSIYFKSARWDHPERNVKSSKTKDYNLNYHPYRLFRLGRLFKESYSNRILFKYEVNPMGLVQIQGSYSNPRVLFK